MAPAPAVLLLVSQVASTSADYQPDERDPEVELVLTESDYTLKMWPHKFKAVRVDSMQGPGPIMNAVTVMGLGMCVFATVSLVAYTCRQLGAVSHIAERGVVVVKGACGCEVVLWLPIRWQLCLLPFRPHHHCVVCYYLCQVYSVTLHGEQLRTDFRILNTGDKPFDFTAALHSYFEVLHVDKAQVRQGEWAGHVPQVLAIRSRLWEAATAPVSNIKLCSMVVCLGCVTASFQQTTDQQSSHHHDGVSAAGCFFITSFWAAKDFSGCCQQSANLAFSLYIAHTVDQQACAALSAV